MYIDAELTDGSRLRPICCQDSQTRLSYVCDYVDHTHNHDHGARLPCGPASHAFCTQWLQASLAT